MARDFSGTTEYLSLGSAPATAVPLTLAAWVNLDNITANHVGVGVFDSGADIVDGFYLSFSGASGGDPVSAVCVAAGNFGVADSSAGYSASTWTHGAAVFSSATARAAYLNGGSKGTNATNLTPSGIVETFVGRYRDRATNEYADGRICEVGIWTAALDDAEVAALAKGMSPLLVRPQSLVLYAPLVRELTNFKGAAFSATGTAVADHTRIIMPKKRQPYSVTAAAAGGTTYPQLERGIRGLNRGLALGSFH